MSNPAYEKLLEDGRWKRRRFDILCRDHWACVKCGASDTACEVHHKYYEDGKMPWEYPDDALETLCRDCHAKAHGIPTVGRCSGGSVAWERRRFQGLRVMTLRVLEAMKRGVKDVR